MAGNRNSGRKSRSAEVEVSQVAGLATRWVLNSWVDLNKEDKLRIFLALAPKYLEKEGNTYHIYADYRTRLSGLSTEQLDALLARYRSVETVRGN